MILFSSYYLSFSFILQYATPIPNQPTLAEKKKKERPSRWITQCQFIYKVLNLMGKALHLAATCPSVHSKSVGNLVLWLYLGPFCPSLHCISQNVPIWKAQFIVSLLMGAKFGWEKQICSSCSLLWKPKWECFFPVFPYPSQCPASHQPVLEEKCWRDVKEGS